MTTQLNITIAGAGLAGSLLAILLAKRGHNVTLVESRPDPRAKGFIGGRSINLALSTRGITALKRAGLAQPVLEAAVPMPGRMLHEPDSKTIFQPYSKNPSDHLNSVSRGGLNLTLINAADEHDNVSILFEHRAANLDLATNTLTLIRPDDTTASLSPDLLIGADGAFSAIRDALRVSDRFDFSQEYLEHGYKELHIPPTADDDWAMPPNALHIWPRGRNMMIALPNADHSFTCTIFWPFHGTHSFDTINTPQAALDYFKRVYPDALPLMPTLAEDFENNPTSSLVTIRCRPWARNRTLIIGDAAHAIVPFYGQGMNAAFEDALLLDDALAANGALDDPAQTIANFARARKPDADAIADLALHNFIEMRDHTASALFLLKKRAEQTLHRVFPRSFTPLYNLVSFTNVPYAQARTRARRQAQAIIAVAIAIPVLLISLVIVLAALL